MKKKIGQISALTSAFCVILAIAGIASAQQLPAADTTRPGSSESETVSKNASGSTATDDDRNKFYQLTRMTTRAFADGDIEKAKAYAQELLKQAPIMQDDWNYGNALHVGNFTLGRIALAAGDMEKAKYYLIESGKTPGSPQLNSFGPNMLLAKELLEKGEREVVVQYFDLCAKFWKKHDGQLDEWNALVLKGEMPDFRANLRYQVYSN